MIRYSHVDLVIACDVSDEQAITGHLGVHPTRMRVSEVEERQADDTFAASRIYLWVLESPSADGDLTARLIALADAIEPFSSRLVSLEQKFHRGIDILYHVTPKHSRGVTGEFDWFRLPAALMRRLAAWDLDVSYETIWFDHPELSHHRSKGLLSRLRRLRVNESSNPATQRTAR